LCENCQRQSCKAFTGLSIRAQIVGGGHPLKYKLCETGETNCNSNLQQCSFNTENNIDICATTDPHYSAVSLRQLSYLFSVELSRLYTYVSLIAYRSHKLHNVNNSTSWSTAYDKERTVEAYIICRWCNAEKAHAANFDLGQTRGCRIRGFTRVQRNLTLLRRQYLLHVTKPRKTWLTDITVSMTADIPRASSSVLERTVAAASTAC